MKHKAELIKFAQEIAKGLPKLSTSIYKSDGGNFTVEVQPPPTEDIETSNNSMQVRHSDGFIRINKSEMVKYSEATRLFLFLWCVFRAYGYSDLEADNKALELMREIQEFSHKQLFKELGDVFKETPQNVKRLEKIGAALKLSQEQKT